MLPPPIKEKQRIKRDEQIKHQCIVTTNENEIRKGVTEFYTEFNNNGNNIDIDNDFLNEMFNVQQNFQDNIHAPITLDEMWNTIKSIRATTPGPDGILNLYIKNYGIYSDQSYRTHETTT